MLFLNWLRFTTTPSFWRHLRWRLFGRLRARHVGVYYDPATKKVLMVRVPDYEDQLEVNTQSGTEMLLMPLSGALTGQTLSQFVAEVEQTLQRSLG